MGTKRLRKYLIRALIGLAALIICGMILVAALNTHEEVVGFSQTVQSWESTLRLFRWTLLILVIAFWEKIIDLLAPVKNLTAEQVAYAKSIQWRVAVILVVFDLLVIEAVPAKLMG